MSSPENTTESLEQPKQAVALSYCGIQELPKIVASGQGEAAKRILELAGNLNIPIHQDQGLANLLSQLSVGSQISPDTFRLVAEVICFLYHVDKLWREEHSFLDASLAAGLKSD